MFIINRVPIAPLLFILLLAVKTVNTQVVDHSNFTVLLFSEIGNKSLVVNGRVNEYFTRNTNKFDCSLTYLYTYVQTDYLYHTNAPYYITISGINQTLGVQITTVHDNFQPSYFPNSCTPPGCGIYIQNNCPGSINFFNYFDRILVDIEGFEDQLTFYVKCDGQFVANTFQWGMVVMIIAITVLIVVVAWYSRAWSLGGHGVRVDGWFVLVFDVGFVLMVVLGYFSFKVQNIFLIVVSFLFVILGVGLCVN